MNCQHRSIDNATWQCTVCGERMESQTVEPETVLSAPNLAAGTDVYVPDTAHAKHVTVGQNVTYTCARCQYDGQHVSDTGVIEDCGHVHRGDRAT